MKVLTNEANVILGLKIRCKHLQPWPICRAAFVTYLIDVDDLRRRHFLLSYPTCHPHQVQQTMKENLLAIEENFSALDERMKKVSK